MQSIFVLPNTIFGGTAYDLVPGLPGILPMTQFESVDGNSQKTKQIRESDQFVKTTQGLVPNPHQPPNAKEKEAIMAGLAKLLTQQQEQSKPGTILAKKLDFSKPYS